MRQFAIKKSASLLLSSGILSASIGLSAAAWAAPCSPCSRNFILIAHLNAFRTAQKLQGVLISNFKSCIRVLHGSDQRLQ